MSKLAEKSKYLEEKEFKDARARISQVAKDMRSGAKEIASWLAKMSRPQLRIIKRDLRAHFSADHVERLALWGKGVIAEHFGVPQKTLPARVLRSLPAVALKNLNNPDHPVELMTMGGLKIITVGNMNAVELATAVDPVDGILPPEDQKVVKPAVERKKQASSDIPVMEKARLAEDKKMILLTAKTGEQMLVPCSLLKHGLQSK